ncbi:MAG: hypothetical protein WDA41_10085 [Candidatus Neomarinimicrobiota bacterium]
MTQNNSSDKVEVRKSYYKSGALWRETPRVNGKEHGIKKWYYESGDLYLEIPYVNGERHGIEKEYYKSGALFGETPYVNGNRHGIAKNYDSDNLNIDVLTLYKGNNYVLTLCCEGYNESSI